MKNFWESCVDEALVALGKMIRKDVRPIESSIKIELINNLSETLNHTKISNIIVYTKITNSFNSIVLICSPLNNYLKLIDMLLHKKIEYYEALDQENIPSVIELGNIINGYFISSLNSLFEEKFNFYETEISTNPYRVIEDFGFGDIYMKKIRVLKFESDFKVLSENINGKLILLTDMNKIDKILENISSKLHIVR